jgi:serine/threonine-protein kinase
MTPERWTEINTVFSAVLEKEPGSRVAYLNQAFGNDAALRDEVARLLRDCEDAERAEFLREAAWVADDIPLFLPDFRDGDSEFQQIEYIGQGGMGVVYKAYEKNFERWVALKFIYPSHLTNSADRERFRAETQSMAKLKHPNIVTVHETGEYQGRPYFVMDLIEGETLNSRVKEFLDRPRETAALMETVALAVHHAHQRRILHNDLKPGNILLDREGQPHITDFGLARRSGDDVNVSAPEAAERARSSRSAEEPEEQQPTTASEMCGLGATGAIEGTASYMSPEQAEGKELTTASDVYGLGAILYTLLTGAPPFRGGTVQQTLRLVGTEVPKPPRILNPNSDATLEAICLKCLSKNKNQRYPSASGLAQEFARYRLGSETKARPWNRRERVVNWCRRNVVEAGLVAAVIAIWIFAVVMALSVAQARKADLRQATLNGVSFAARDLATTALLQLRLLGRNVDIATADPRLAALLLQNDRAGLQRLLADICEGQPIPFKTCYIINRDGVMVAHVPIAEQMIGRDFSWRNHFQAARALGLRGIRGSVHISRVYRGKSDGFYKFAVTAPILDQRNDFLGTVATSIITDASMGLVILHENKRKAALVAPTDIDSPEAIGAKTTDQYVIAYHPGYRKGVVPVRFPYSRKFKMPANESANEHFQLADSKVEIPPDDGYIDPASAVAPEYGGRWIAGFAPVGNTGFVVVVQQRFKDAVSLESSTLWDLALWSALASVLAVGVLVAFLWRWAKLASARQA